MIFGELASQWVELWRPSEKLPLSQWSEKNFKLSEYSARTGKLTLYGWQKEPVDAFTDPTVETIVLCCGTQLLKTLLIQLATAYVIAEEPGPALIVQPKESDAESFSRERLSPMIRDNECLRTRIIDAGKAKSSSNTVLAKTFHGGSLALVGSIAPGNLARRSIRYLFCDELDKYPASAGAEGDPVGLARERTVTFGSRRKIILVCSPTVEGNSRIGLAYQQSDQRKPWVPCHACGQRQVLKFSQVKFDKYDSDGKALRQEQRPGTARYECVHCGVAWTDVQRWNACEQAQWVADAAFTGTAGFWISHLYSPWKTLRGIVADFLTAKQDRQTLKVFTNTTLAELWTEEGEAPEWEIVKGRSENYPFNDDAVVPMRALFLTAFVDVQADRLEYEVAAWSRHRENWSIAYGVIQCFDANQKPLQSSNDELWVELDKVLARDWKHASGKMMPIMVMGIDTGFRPKPVYEFAKRHAQPAYRPSGIRVHAPRSVCPTKGSSTETLRLLAGISKEDAARKRQGVRIVSIGTAFAKQELFDNLRIPKPVEGTPTAGYCHHPQYSEDYFRGLCAEKRIVHDNGSVSYEKVFPRNEPLDCKVGNRAMAALYGVDRFHERAWQALERMYRVEEEETVAPEHAMTPTSAPMPMPMPMPQPNPAPMPSQAPRPVAQPYQRIRSNWMNR